MNYITIYGFLENPEGSWRIKHTGFNACIQIFTYSPGKLLIASEFEIHRRRVAETVPIPLTIIEAPSPGCPELVAI